MKADLAAKLQSAMRGGITAKTGVAGVTGEITKAQIQEIAEKKLPDLNCIAGVSAVMLVVPLRR